MVFNEVEVGYKLILPDSQELLLVSQEPTEDESISSWFVLGTLSDGTYSAYYANYDDEVNVYG